jgi:hypothetical protein
MAHEIMKKSEKDIHDAQEAAKKLKKLPNARDGYVSFNGL